MLNGKTDKAKSIFVNALDQPTSGRGSFLDRACDGDVNLRAEVEKYLADHDRAGDFLAGPGMGRDAVTVDAGSASVVEAPGSIIGRYKLLQKIGEGGFGVVFMADQEKPVRRMVALKVIKLGMDTREVVARFEAERQALAMMDHPNIARVLDAGSTDTGRPYFVMELVRGLPITEYADKHKLSTTDRIALAVTVCRAVQHAHGKGIIHRDLKPSNVVVTVTDDKAVPKVIDFGIAKATQSKLTDRTLFTAYRQMIGTPQYMSPEQADSDGSDIDTRTDVYSLGVLLYELLVGTTPHDARALRSAAYDEMRKLIRDSEVPRLSTKLNTMAADSLGTIATNRSTDLKKLNQSVKGELDWIVMKALEKDRSRRYETASAMADDLNRHLAGDAVMAGPVSSLYRLKKTARRYKAAFAVAAAVAVVLLVGIGGTTWGLVRESHLRAKAESAELKSAVSEKKANDSAATAVAEKAEAQKQRAEAIKQKDLAESAREDAQNTSTFLTNVFQSPDPTRDGRTITVVELLDKAADKLETDLATQPRRRAHLQTTLAHTYNTLGLNGKAIPLLKRCSTIAVPPPVRSIPKRSLQ